VGYVGEVSEDMLNQPQFELYRPGDVVGRSGVELRYNQLLMGANGSRQVVVNSHGKEVGEALDEKPAVPGKPLKLTIDVDLQIQPKKQWKARMALSWQWIRTPAKFSRWRADLRLIPTILRFGLVAPIG